MKRICVNLTAEQAAALQERANETGVLQSEQIRRAIDLSLLVGKSQQRSARPAQPVLVALKARE